MNKSINCKGKLIVFDRPKVMGILNLTPNSFYDGGSYSSVSDALKKVEKMLSEGADFIDIGAYSSKPNAEFVSSEEEMLRLIPVLEKIIKNFPQAIISIDTFRAEVAKKAIDIGASIINDISGGVLDEQMFDEVAKAHVPYILMHMRGTPQNKQQFTVYEDVTKDVALYFSKRIALAIEKGIKDIIIDPGFGFAKTLDQNYELMKNLSFLKNLNFPILSGVSRKSMIYKYLQISPEDALNGTTALNMFSLINGANILRVHDVKEAVECVKLYNKLYEK